MGKHHRFPRLLPFLLASLPVVAPLACGNTSDAPAGGAGFPSGIFGGSAGVAPSASAGTTALGSAGVGSLPVDVCLDVPRGTRALIDDFEDGDSLAVPEPDREAYWFTIKDPSPGIIEPDTNFLPVPGGAHGSARAAHIKASGFTVWGAGFAANVTHLAGGIRCPYNATQFSGLRFFARGSGEIRAELLIPEVVDRQFGGKCDPSAGDVCYDTHGVSIPLTSEWKAYSFPWQAFVQRNYGLQAAFRPEAIMSLQFSFELSGLPVDVWFDDVSFEDGSPLPPLGTSGEGGAAGVPGAGGAPSEGGASSEGGAPGAGGVGRDSGGASSAGQEGT